MLHFLEILNAIIMPSQDQNCLNQRLTVYLSTAKGQRGKERQRDREANTCSNSRQYTYQFVRAAYRKKVFVDVFHVPCENIEVILVNAGDGLTNWWARLRRQLQADKKVT